MENFSKNVAELVYFLDDIKGKRLYSEVKNRGLKEIETRSENRQAYLDLQFLIIPWLATNEIGDLLKNHLLAALNNHDIDLPERLKKKFLLLPDLDARDQSRQELKRFLLDNSEIFFQPVESADKRSISTVRDWLVEYSASTKESTGKVLNRAQFLHNNLLVQKLDQEAKQKLGKLILLFDYLESSSFSPDGFEDDLLLKLENGDLVTSNKGEIVVLSSENGSIRMRQKKARTIVGPPQTEEEKKITQLEKAKTDTDKSALEKKVIDEAGIAAQNKIADLKILANKYPSGSLERRAVETEIKKLEVRS